MVGVGPSVVIGRCVGVAPVVVVLIVVDVIGGVPVETGQGIFECMTVLLMQMA